MDARRRQAQDVAARVRRGAPTDRAAAAQVDDAGKSYGFEPFIHTPELLDRVREDWREATPFVQWVADHAGGD